MTDHKRDRDEVLAFLRYELVGPWEPWAGDTAITATGAELDTSGDLKFEDRESAYGPFVQLGTGEEILQRDRPCKRYGVGEASRSSGHEPDDLHKLARSEGIEPPTF